MRRRSGTRPRPSARDIDAAAHAEQVLRKRRELVREAFAAALRALRQGDISPRQYDRDHARLSRELWQVEFELQRFIAVRRAR